jgi:murein DD-endopeptidase MepM/ murein hydrolase activator NlpD
MSMLHARWCLVLGFCCLTVLGACTSPQTVVSSGRYGMVPIPRPKPTDSASAAASRLGSILVLAGESLYDVAVRAGVTPRELIEANNLPAPFKVRAGQVLKVPTPALYVVQSGETATGLARRFGMSLSQLVRLNQLEPPYQLKRGQRLILPPVNGARAPTEMAVNDAATPRAAVPPSPSLPPAAPIPQRPGPEPRSDRITSEPLAPLKPQQPDVTISAPQPLPQAITPSPPVMEAPVTRKPLIEEPVPQAEAPQAAPPPVAPPAPEPPVQTAMAPEPATAPPPALPKGGAKFIWPVQSGEVISRFGAKSSGLFNDGLNIAAREGTPVLAAADGTVAYAGQELKGFGNLVLIRHANGWMSAYAHNEALLVARGDQVRRGQPIARMGKTGNVDRPQVHFELRQETEAVDPLKYLPRTGNRPRLG